MFFTQHRIFTPMQKTTCNLDHCFLCRHSLPEWKELVAIKKQTFLIKKGRQVFEEGDAVQGIFFMNEGTVKVSKNWGEQKELILRFARPGDVLGHRGFGGDLQYPVSATAIEETKLCFVDNAFLASSLAANTNLTFQFMQLYAAELQRIEKRMRDLAHMDVKGRIAQALLDIQATFGTGGDAFIAVPVSRQDIASYAGTTYETVFKFFTELTAKEALVTVGKNLKIRDRKALETYLKTASFE